MALNLVSVAPIAGATASWVASLVAASLVSAVALVVSRVASGTSARVASGTASATRVASGAASASSDLHVGDLGPVAVLVSLVLNHLPAAVGQNDVVHSPGVVAVSGLLVSKVVTGRRVVHRVLELVLGGFLVEKDASLFFSFDPADVVRVVLTLLEPSSYPPAPPP